jgi:hypothetical protein
MKIQNKFDKNLGLLAFWLAIAMGIRNTSILGWVPLLLLKMVQKSAYIPFILTGLLVALPSLALVVLLDSIYYGGLTFTAWNFFVINVLENLSAAFGVQPWSFYLTETLPEALGTFSILPMFVIGVFYNIYRCWLNRELPSILIFSAANLLIVSRVEHKESRFILPIIPYLILMASEVITKIIAKKGLGKIATLVLILVCVRQQVFFIAGSIGRLPNW